MDNDIEIVKINTADAAVLSATAKKTFYDTFTGTCTPADMEHFLEYYYSEKVILGEIEKQGYHYYFAKKDNEVIGYLLFAENNEEFKNYERALELKRFYVLEAYQGKGAAQQMMDFFLAFATEHKYPLVFLGVWEYNYKAQNFYGKYGFVKTNHTHSFPVGATPQLDVYMCKVI
jgi:diamine N-acetyltransferase